MQNINCLIIEDDLLAGAVLVSLVNGHSRLTLLQKVETLEEARRIIRVSKPDLVFVDIDLPDGEGSTLVYELQNTATKVIMTTGFSHFAIEGYNLQVVDYLLKPYTAERFIKAVERAIHLLENDPIFRSHHSSFSQEERLKPIEGSQKNQQFVFIRVDGVMQKLNADEILFAEASGDKVKIVTTNNTHQIYHAFYKFIESLPPSEFIKSVKAKVVARMTRSVPSVI
jgi:DNA-binding LytR/AlgR family response regulator